MNVSSGPATTNFIDVRMRGFRNRAGLEDAWTILNRHISVGPVVPVELTEAAGRVLAGEVTSSVNIPAFPRAAMDGYAIRSADSSTAGRDCVITFRLVGEARPGSPSLASVHPGEAVQIMTGAPIPDGADCVIPVERTEIEGSLLRIATAIPVGKNISCVGEDVSQGSVVLSKGRKLRPQDVGLLASIGVGNPSVYAAPRVALLMTGNELLTPGSKPEGCNIVDSNSVMLRSLIRRDGGIASEPMYPRDEPNSIREALLNAAAEVIVVSGGSSVGKEDHVPAVVAELGTMLVHGIAVRPGSPAGFGTVGDKLVFLLPGNPVACLVGYDLLASKAIRVFGGLSDSLPYASVELPLCAPIVSVVGRVDYVRVRITTAGVEAIAGSGGSRLSTTVEADGFVLVDAARERYEAGESVRVYRYDSP